jgi:Flp pilus assembly pilin Flp
MARTYPTQPLRRREIGMSTRLNEASYWLVTRKHLQREDGQALTEYSLILGIVSIVAIALLTTIGTDAKNVLKEVVEAFPGA